MFLRLSPLKKHFEESRGGPKWNQRRLSPTKPWDDLDGPNKIIFCVVQSDPGNKKQAKWSLKLRQQGKQDVFRGGVFLSAIYVKPNFWYTAARERLESRLDGKILDWTQKPKSLKEGICSAVNGSHPNSTAARFGSRCHQKCLEAAIFHPQHNKLKLVVSCVSRLFSKPLRKYAFVRKKTLMLLIYVAYFRHWLLGRQCTIRAKPQEIECTSSKTRRGRQRGDGKTVGAWLCVST